MTSEVLQSFDCPHSIFQSFCTSKTRLERGDVRGGEWVGVVSGADNHNVLI